MNNQPRSWAVLSPKVRASPTDRPPMISLDLYAKGRVNLILAPGSFNYASSFGASAVGGWAADAD